MTHKKFFGCDVIRAMGASGAALEIGLDGIALVSLVVMEWDRFDYAKPCPFRLSHLIDRTGVKNKQAYYRIEERCVKAGWLIKKPNGTRGPLLYEVAIPEAGRLVRFISDDDPNSDEIRTNEVTESGPKECPIPDHKPTNPALSLSDSPSLDIPIPNPDPDAREADQDLFKPKPKPKPTETDAEIAGLFSAYVVCFSRDPGRTEENQRLLVTLYRAHGRLALHAAEKAAFDAHERVYPDRVADRLIALRADQSEAETRTKKRTGPPTPYETAVGLATTMGWETAAKLLADPRIDSPQALDHFLWSNPGWCELLIERSAKAGAA